MFVLSQPCGGFETNVRFEENPGLVDDVDRGLVELRSLVAQYGDSVTIHRAEITYPGHRVNIEIEYTRAVPDVGQLRQLLVAYPGKRDYMAVYSVTEGCFAAQESAIRASVMSFRDRSSGPRQAPTTSRKSNREVLVGLLVGACGIAFFVFLWRRFRN